MFHLFFTWTLYSVPAQLIVRTTSKTTGHVFLPWSCVPMPTTRSRSLLHKDITYEEAHETETNVLHQLGHLEERRKFYYLIYEHRDLVQQRVAHHLGLHSGSATPSPVGAQRGPASASSGFGRPHPRRKLFPRHVLLGTPHCRPRDPEARHTVGQTRWNVTHTSLGLAVRSKHSTRSCLFSVRPPHVYGTTAGLTLSSAPGASGTSLE